MARELLVATGDTHEYGPANFHRGARNARAEAEFVSELFLGARLRCANCHNHPLDRWTQDDYHGLAAVFAKLERGRQVRVGRRGDVTHPRTGEPAAPRIPGVRFLDANADGRQELADWLTSETNPYFAKAFVNRLWKAMMGRGLIEPTDDLRETNPATHPRLLEELANDFAEHGYHLRHTLRLIAGSDAYARSAAPAPGNAADDRFYSHAAMRPLAPEVLADALAQVTGVAEKYGDLPLGTRAISLPHPGVKSEALDILGRCDRQDSCESTSGDAGGLPMRLHLLNGALINQKITADAGRLSQLIKEGRGNEPIVEEFYLRALGRRPRQTERAYWKQKLPETGAERRKALEDFLWSLLNCKEFATR